MMIFLPLKLGEQQDTEYRRERAQFADMKRKGRSTLLEKVLAWFGRS